MSLFNRFFGSGKPSTKPRTRVCLDCGMPLANHKEWCAIFRAEADMAAKKKAKAEDQAG